MMNENVSLTVGEVLERAIQIEKSAADLYAIFSKRFSHVPGMSDFWKDLQRDEIHHMGELQVIRETLPAEKLRSSESGATCASLNRALAAIGDVCLSEIKTLDDAYELAHDLEFSEINAIFEYLTTDLVSLSFLRDVVTYHIEGHQQKLVNFDKKHGNKTWRSMFSIQPE